ncbi:MAG: hypothetical protein NZO58_11655, partial [Gemmataceae bacterium]|nr:hypothetical protein [Gemmataceae bacterium]
SDAKSELVIDQVQPSALKVHLAIDRDAPPGPKTRWKLEVQVPPDQQINDDSAITLRLKNADPPRRIRIPIVGHAVQG